jgi:uncharacterized zinc-type alcohol dehydrogenase-like protein
MIHTKAYAAYEPTKPLAPFEFTRRAVGAKDVQIEILYCGVCHRDLHQARDEWGGSIYPMVPGHEIVGKVVAVGNDVTKFKVGDIAGVGVMVDSCKTCKNCSNHLEQYCAEGMTGTYNAIERDGKTVAQGGYSTQIVVDEHYVLKVSPTLDLKSVAPLLCAGITTYSPLKFAGVTKGMKVAVVGLGGLGHMGVKFAASSLAALIASRIQEFSARASIASAASRENTSPKNSASQSTINIAVNLAAAAT